MVVDIRTLAVERSERIEPGVASERVSDHLGELSDVQIIEREPTKGVRRTHRHTMLGKEALPKLTEHRLIETPPGRDRGRLSQRNPRSTQDNRRSRTGTSPFINWIRR